MNASSFAKFVFHTIQRIGVVNRFLRTRNRLLAIMLGVRSISIGPASMLLGLSHISVGENFWAYKELWLEAITDFKGDRFSPQILIGDNVSVSCWSHIAAVDRVEIGAGTLIGSKVIITDHNHGSYGPDTHSSPHVPPDQRPLAGRPVFIGKNVWIGDGVVVTPGAHIGEGCIIGANAVVTGWIPDFTIAVGIPAKPIKTFDFNKSEWVPLSKAVESQETSVST